MKSTLIKRISSIIKSLTLIGILVIAPVALAKDLPGSSETSYGVGQSGAFNFTIPIVVPQGRNGVQPNLSLSFSSSGGNSRVGVGWDIAGLSSITRCGKSVASHGRFRGVMHDGQDRYCLDGQLLIVTKGRYGAEGSEYRTEVDQFVNVVGHGRVANLNGGHSPARFTVYRKDGSIWEYGLGGNSDFKLPGTNTIHCWKVSVVRDRNGNEYRVSYRTQDAFPASIDYTTVNGTGGNKHVKFNYEARPDARKRYILGHAINYNVRLSNVQVLKGNTQVRRYNLNYETAPITKLSRLTSVQECGLNSACMPPIEIDWKRSQKGFSASSTFSPVEAMVEYNASGQAVTRGQFADVNGDGYPDQVIAYRDTGGRLVSRTYLGSQDGLSRTASTAWRMPMEFIEYTTGIVSHSQLNSHQVIKAQLVDVNADGLPDVVFGFQHPFIIRAPFERTFKRERGVYLNNGNGWDSTVSSTFVPPEYFNSYTDNRALLTHFNNCPNGCLFASYIHTPRGQFVDINGDGLVDWITAVYVNTNNNNGTRTKAVYLNNGTRWVRDAAYSDSVPDVFVRYLREHNMPTGNLVDLNGDGLLDWIQSYFWSRDGNTPHRGVWLNTGTRFEPAGNQHQALPTIVYENFGNSENPRQHGTFVDLNGDGLTDYLADSGRGSYLPGYAQGRISYLNTGKGWVRASGYDAAGRFQHRYNRAQGVLFVGGQYLDLNQDGLVDYSESNVDRSGTSHQNSWINTGSGWIKDNSYNLGLNYYNNQGDNPRPVLGQFVDVNADGSPDWLRTRSGFDLSAHLNQLVRPNEVSQITTTMGVEVKPTFLPLTANDDLYKKHDPGNEVAPEPNSYFTQMPLYVTSRLATSAADGGPDTVMDYQYRGAQVNTQGRGFLGFRARYERDLQKDLHTYAEYSQTFPFIGMMTQGAVSSASHDLSISRNELASRTLTHANGNTTRFAYVEQSTAQSFDLNSGNLAGTVTASLRYDDYGNVITSRTTHANAAGSVKRTVTTDVDYDIDTTNWLISRATSQSMSYSRPGQASITNTSTTYYKTNRPHLVDRVVREEAPVGGAQANSQAINSPDRLRLTTQYEYDAVGNVVQERQIAANAADRISTIDYDAENRLPTTVTNAAGHRIRTVYDANCDRPALVRDVANNRVTTTDYDDFCRPIEQIDAAGVISTTGYDASPAACANCQTRPAFATTSHTQGSTPVVRYFNQYNQVLLVQTTDIAGRTINQATHYDEVGREAGTSQPFFTNAPQYWTSNEYDALDRLTRTRLPYVDRDGTQVQLSSRYTVDPLSGEAIVTSIDTQGRPTTTVTNQVADVVRVTDALGNSMTYHYDARGALTNTVDAHGNTITVRYDALGRRVALDDPSLGLTSYVLNAFGEITEQTDANGHTLQMHYDVLGRLTQRIVPNTNNAVNNGEPEVSTWTYDTAPNGVGQVASITGANGYVKTYQYDTAGRPIADTTTIKGDTFTQRWVYNAFGQLAERHYPNSGVDAAGNPIPFGVKYAYTNGYLSTISSYDENPANCIEHWRINESDALGRVLSETLGTLVQSRRTYDPAQGVLTGIQSTLTQGASAQDRTVQDLNYTYDIAGNMSRRENALNTTNPLESFTFDDLDRLKTHQQGTNSVTVNYDAIGNITYKSDVGTYTYAQNTNNQNSLRLQQVDFPLGANSNLAQLTVNIDWDNETVSAGLPNIQGQAFIYDKVGSIKTSGNRDVYWTAFDKPYQMVSRQNTTQRGSTIEYGPDFNRVFKQEAQYNALGHVERVTERTIYLGKAYQRITDGNGQVTHRYSLSAGSQTIEVTRENNTNFDQTKYLLTDNLGSTQTILNTLGQVEQTQGFDPWGHRLNTTDTPVNQLTDRGYTGHETDDEVGLINMNARIYDPYLGRFLSADPVIPDAGDMQAFNRYAYVLNNPMKYTDPTGNMPASITVEFNGRGSAVGFRRGGFGFGRFARFGEFVRSEFGGGFFRAIFGEESITVFVIIPSSRRFERRNRPMTEPANSSSRGGRGGIDDREIDPNAGVGFGGRGSGGRRAGRPLQIIVDDEISGVDPNAGEGPRLTNSEALDVLIDLIRENSVDIVRDAFDRTREQFPGSDILINLSGVEALFEGGVSGDLTGIIIGVAAIFTGKIRATRGTAAGARAGKKHTPAAIREAKRRNAEQNNGDVLCTSCGVKTTPTTRRTKGSTVNPREGQGDHIFPRSKGGNGATVKDQSNIDIKCASCNNAKSDNI